MVIPNLIGLSREADTLEAKGRVTQCLNVLIESVDTRIAPYVEAVATPVPELCEFANNGIILMYSSDVYDIGKEAEGESAEYLYKASLLDTVAGLIGVCIALFMSRPN